MKRKIAAEAAQRSPLFWWCIALAPALSFALIFGTAISVSGTGAMPLTGGELMVLLAVLFGIPLGMLLAWINRGHAMAAATFSALATVCLYWSIRAFWFDAPFTLNAAGFALLIPACMLGAHAFGLARKLISGRG